LKPKTKTTTLSRTPGGAAPMFAGMPPGDDKAIVPGVPQLDVAPVTQVAVPPPAPAAVPGQAGPGSGQTDSGPDAAEPGTGGQGAAEPAAAEPVAAMKPMSEGGPIGLLALIAAVCVLGVGSASIRAIVSQRANRARIA
jgi:hypothetical protein